MNRQPNIRHAMGAMAVVIVTLLPTLASADADGAVDVDGFTVQSTRLVARVCWVAAKCNPGPPTYTLDSAPVGTCLSASVDEPTPADTDAGACRMTASGNYINVVCGTGIATGDAVLQEPGAEGTEYDAPNFFVEFVGWIGIIVAPTVTEVGDAENTSGTGVLLLSPKDSTPTFPALDPVFRQAPGPINFCADGFSVDGAFATNA